MLSSLGTSHKCNLQVLALTISVALSGAPCAAKVLHAFQGGSDGRNPDASLIADGNGNLYGTTVLGGGSACQFGDGCGTVFKLAPGGAETVLYAFQGGNDGYYPEKGALLRDNAGNLFGAAGGGGVHNNGTIFELTAGGTFEVLYAFQGGSDGNGPFGGLIQDQAGNFYGVTAQGGGTGCNNNLGCGTVFELKTDGTEMVLHAFQGGSDGEAPNAGLVMDNAGNLYGTTLAGVGTGCGGSGCGTVFKLAPDGTETFPHIFQGGSDGGVPFAGLISDASGNVYGTTWEGGNTKSCTSGCGTVFKVSPSGQETVLYAFHDSRRGEDAMNPEASLVMDTAGNLYGTTYDGGSDGCKQHGIGYGCGAVFKLSPDGREKVLYAFTSGLIGRLHGDYPAAGLLLGANGLVYGTTTAGGSANDGVVFSVKK